MIDDRRIAAERITDEAGRGAALQVLSATYQREKGWIADPDHQFPASDVQRQDIAWFIARFDGCPAGVLRTLYDPPLLQYAKYRLKLIDTQLDVEAFSSGIGSRKSAALPSWPSTAAICCLRQR